jgi:sulfate adenylyltransferase subunit 2
MPVAETEPAKSSPQSPAVTLPRLNHLRLLEAESIHILREVASEFERPVMLYSIGKDSSVMLRLAQKAFHPGPIPFPLLHIDTGFKFAEMLTFRDEMARKVGAELLVWRNEPAIAAGTNPIVLDTKRCCGLLKTQALLDALRHYKFDAAFGGARRDEEKSRAKGTDLLLPRWRGAVGPEEPAARAVEPVQRAHPSGRKHSRVSAFELDRDGRVAVHPRGKDSGGRFVLR